MVDVIVVGGGPAGMTAALYALRNGKSVLILEKHGFGGQITYSPKVENWPGTAQMSGNEFADALLDQVMAQGAEVDLAEVLRVEATPERVVQAPREETAVRETEDTRATLPLRKELLRTPDPKADAEALRRKSLWRPLGSGPT